jgi:MFS family permease
VTSGTDSIRSGAFLRYFSGRTISSFGSSFGFLALTFAILAAGGSATDLGLVIGAGTLPMFLLMLLGGVAGDRFDRRLILVSTDVVQGAAQLATAALFATGAAPLWVLMLLQAVRGAASAFFNPTSTGMMPELVAPDDLQRANALVGIASNIASVVGPALAGVTIALTSPTVALVVDAATFLVSAVLLATLPRGRGRVKIATGILDDVKGGWREFTSRAWVWQMVASFAVYQASVLPVIVVVGPVLAERTGAGASGWAVVLSLRAAGSLLAGLVLLRWRPKRPLVASTLCLGLDVPFLLALGLDAPILAQAVLGAFAAGGVVLADTLWESALQRWVPTDAISRVSSFDWMGSLAMNPVGNVLVALALTGIGPRDLIYTVVVVHIASHGLLLLSPAIRSLRTPAATA